MNISSGIELVHSSLLIQRANYENTSYWMYGVKLTHIYGTVRPGPISRNMLMRTNIYIWTRASDIACATDIETIPTYCGSTKNVI